MDLRGKEDRMAAPASPARDTITRGGRANETGPPPGEGDGPGVARAGRRYAAAFSTASVPPRSQASRRRRCSGVALGFTTKPVGVPWAFTTTSMPSSA
jgi:hypothetical protein